MEDASPVYPICTWHVHYKLACEVGNFCCHLCYSRSIHLSSCVPPVDAGTQSSAVKKAICMLGDIDAPPAFASEFPAKGAALLLNSASHSSNPVHTTAGMIHLGDMAMSGNGIYWSLEKHPDYNILSLALPQNDAKSSSLERIGKAGAVMGWGCLYLFFVWALILSASCKIGSYFYSGKAA